MSQSSPKLNYKQIHLKLPIVIVGMGKSGLAALQLLNYLGVPREQILTFDDKLGVADSSHVTDILNFSPQTLVVSPGFPLNTIWVQELRSQGAEITSEINLAAYFLENEKVIGVTGSVGKSTTTAAIGAALQSFDPNAFVGGNIGTPFCEYALRIFKAPEKRAHWIVLELSSFQLENVKNLKLDACVCTFLSENHLERYESVSSYYNTKLNLLRQTGGPIVLNKNGGDLQKIISTSTEFLNSKNIFWVDRGGYDLETWSQAALIGSHNHDNLALALFLANFFHWPPESRKSILDFKGLRHRLEKVVTSNGITYVNDSKATSIESVLTAVQACLDSSGSKQIHLLLGGRDKNLPWIKLQALSKNPRLHFYFFGESAEKIKTISGLSGHVFEKLKEATIAAKSMAHTNDFVLLSPGGTSLDEFKNFEHRGDEFIRYLNI